MTPWPVGHQAPLSMGFPAQEYWSGLPLLTRGHLPDPWIEPMSPALADRFFPTEPTGKPQIGLPTMKNSIYLPSQVKKRTNRLSTYLASSYISKGNENSILTRYIHSGVYCSIMHNSQYLNGLNIYQWIKSCMYVCVCVCMYVCVCIYIYIYIYYSALRKKKGLSFNKVTILQGIMLSEISQTEKAK